LRLVNVVERESRNAKDLTEMQKLQPLLLPPGRPFAPSLTLPFPLPRVSASLLPASPFPPRVLRLSCRRPLRSCCGPQYHSSARRADTSFQCLAVFLHGGVA